jgi:hypothetical protein
MATNVQRLLVLPILLLYSASTLGGMGLHALSGCPADHSCQRTLAATDFCHVHAHRGAVESEASRSAADRCAWRSTRAAAGHDEQSCPVCQFVAHSQLRAHRSEVVAAALALGARIVAAIVAPPVRRLAGYCPRGPPAVGS